MTTRTMIQAKEREERRAKASYYLNDICFVEKSHTMFQVQCKNFSI